MRSKKLIAINETECLSPSQSPENSFLQPSSTKLTITKTYSNKGKFMLICFKFHLYSGIRAGGGIGDELESPNGDPLELFRIIFDITFFFFIIVILLAIIQGLIIDAFGDLREQLESVKETLEVMHSGLHFLF
ncbi:unnamed protein product, partial [Rotaria magnacalcarata]